MKTVFATLLVLVIGLTGCASVRLIDSQVSSFAPHPVPAGASYRFERLPSQQQQAPAQEQLETMAAQALSNIGLTHRATPASLTVLVSASQRVQSTQLESSDLGWNMGWSMGNRLLIPGLNTQVSYWYDVSLILRDPVSQTVLYETHVSHDGPWADRNAVLPAMLAAALHGFPNPPAGVRRVAIEIRR